MDIHPRLICRIFPQKHIYRLFEEKKELDQLPLQFCSLLSFTLYVGRTVRVHHRIRCPLPSTNPHSSMSHKHNFPLTYPFSRSSSPYFPLPSPIAPWPSTSPTGQNLFCSCAASSSIFAPSLWRKTHLRSGPMNSHQLRLQDYRQEMILRQAFTRAVSRLGNVRSTWHNILSDNGRRLVGLLEPEVCMLLSSVLAQLSQPWLFSTSSSRICHYPPLIHPFSSHWQTTIPPCSTSPQSPTSYLRTRYTRPALNRLPSQRQIPQTLT